MSRLDCEDGIDEPAWERAMAKPISANPGCDKCTSPAAHAVSCGTCAKVYRRCTDCGGRRAAMRQLSSHWTYVGKDCPRGLVGLDEAVAP